MKPIKLGAMFFNFLHLRGIGLKLGQSKNSFNNSYNKHSSLLLRAALVSGTSMAIGDVICQNIHIRAGKEGEYAIERSIRMGAIGIFISGPVNYAILAFIEYLFPGKISLKALFKKVAVQSSFTPLFCFLILSSSEILKPGSSFQDVKNKLQKDYIRTVTTAWCFWPFVSLFNNWFVPFPHRANFSSIVGLFWNVIISYLANLSADRDKENISEITAQVSQVIESAELQAQFLDQQAEMQEEFENNISLLPQTEEAKEEAIRL